MFQNLYEIFGINPFYSANFAQFLAGTEDILEGDCSNWEGVKLYMFFGMVMLISTALTYALQYHIIDKAKFSGPKWWWIFGGAATLFNFAFAFIKLYTFTLPSGDAFIYCTEEYLSNFSSLSSDIFMFAADNAIWSLIIFALLSCPPLLRTFSKNCSRTTAFTH